MKQEEDVRTGTVCETMPNLLYRVEFADGKTCIAYPSGKMKLNKIKMLIGDRVTVVMDPYEGKNTNRITRRL